MSENVSAREWQQRITKHLCEAEAELARQCTEGYRDTTLNPERMTEISAIAKRIQSLRRLYDLYGYQANKEAAEAIKAQAAYEARWAANDKARKEAARRLRREQRCDADIYEPRAVMSPPWQLSWSASGGLTPFSDMLPIPYFHTYFDRQKRGRR
jgi:hypothetical protein